MPRSVRPMAAPSLTVPDSCSDAVHAEVVLSGDGNPFLILMAEEGIDFTVVHLDQFLDFVAGDPRLRCLMEKSLRAQL